MPRLYMLIRKVALSAYATITLFTGRNKFDK
ncbi:hypothetical protein F383_08245 [Gossypium arboreum]|uniref:Uncharacterized protein n=1 Tax=Gossypium arboreum TaxID=29729 RepID=A0A0B0PNA2_GOSAR|nr:hypothetical protein F383_08245 [Gossypium arboreum]